MKQYFIILFVLISLGCKQSKESIPTPDIQPSKLIALFKASKSDFPNISVHRGGKGLVNYPENCLETLQFVSDSIVAIYEVDVAQTKDNQLVLLHDKSIDRTTTGSGKVVDLTYSELKQFYLVDDHGNETDFKIPLFADVLSWSKKNNVILTIDIKRSVRPEVVIEAIRKAEAEDISIIITYDVDQAINAYNLAPDLLLSVSARNNDEFERLLNAKIPTENMLAFTGTRLSDASLYKRLHDNNIVCMLGTLGNLDRSAQANGDELYIEWKEKGADIMATDRPFEAYKAIN
ncbi:glycerophosphodiester phosphodiesterase family protein [Winogradskyella bathintestinalis]|uniref:Glycerophosphodiester phosphodiesterase family protein n=1 Tax=Winogradskyella bathintestinalis TaxID=3035208 RepID=A0ABT7ZVP2_9FLAO|nr:glycerophosphodiester phosphodiesterase family protein [Winogradskyella bathintestinalis]MDN3493069.1 glycerophosphodiester phosphodiesterase family protein [Winogradskyella bathintestinalis]